MSTFSHQHEDYILCNCFGIIHTFVSCPSGGESGTADLSYIPYYHIRVILPFTTFENSASEAVYIIQCIAWHIGEFTDNGCMFFSG